MTAKAAYNIMLNDAASGWCPAKLVQTFVDLHRKRYAGDRRSGLTCAT